MAYMTSYRWQPKNWHHCVLTHFYILLWMFAHSYKIPIVTVMNGTFIVLICVCVGFFFCLRNKRVQKAKKYNNKLHSTLQIIHEYLLVLWLIIDIKFEIVCSWLKSLRNRYHWINLVISILSIERFHQSQRTIAKN